MMLYFAETLLVGSVLWGFWRVALRGKVAHGWSRRYLVAAMALTVLLPALDIPLYPAPETGLPHGVAVTAPLLGYDGHADAVAPSVPVGVPVAAETSAVDWRKAAVVVYVLVASLFALLFAVRIIRIRLLRRRAHLTRCRHYTLACHAAIRTPFSFLRTIFLGEGVEGRNREVVIMHEASHVRHGHSWERIAAEIVRVVLWLNPFVWLAARALEEVQECEADTDVLDSGCDMREYRQLILNQLFGYNPDIACGLGNSLTKNRFIMMTRSKRHRHAALRLGAAIPVVVAMMMLCSFTTRTPEPAAISEKTTAVTTPENRELQVVEIKLLNSGGMTISNGFTLESLADASRRGDWIAVRIMAEDKVRMGSITDLKESLRKLKLYRVQYASAEGGGNQTRMLSPSAGRSGEVEVLGAPVPADRNSDKQNGFTIARRNLYEVRIDSRGELLAGVYNSQKVVGTYDLSADIKRFLLNSANDTDLSAKRVSGFTLPDGRKENYPVSEGLVTIFCAADTPYDAYLAAQQAIGAAFEELRNELSGKWFGRPYRDLALSERNVVAQAVPMKIAEAEPRK